ncbi:MAG: hypothetical protein AAF591_05655 [Verrucomicrobiota bacterium]
MSNRNLDEAVILGGALTVAPAAVGCALGILMGQRMGREASHGAAATLFALGVVSVLPCAVDLISRRLNGPSTSRGQMRQQELIRDGGMVLYDEVVEGGDDGERELREVV